jgi:GLPGLI family protein
MKQLFVACLALAIALPTLAQKKFEGTVTYALEYKDLPAEMAMMESMLPDEMTTRIKGEKSRLEQSLGMGMSQVTITDSKKESGTLLLDMMGKKIAVEMSKAELEKMEKGDDKKKPEFKYVDGAEKKIAGYNCKKAMVIMEGAGEMEVYYTEEIPATASKHYEGLKGFPLEYTINAGQFKMKMTAKEVKSEKIDAALFVVPSGYEKMTFEEFQKSMSGMMGG